MDFQHIRPWALQQSDFQEPLRSPSVLALARGAVELWPCLPGQVMQAL